MFKINFLPARFGDSIWIEYGDPQSPHLILIDGGTAGTRTAIAAELNQIPADKRHLDLLVITHIDRDHIEGVLGLLDKKDPGFQVDDLWFNGWPHLPENPDEAEPFGALQGERLSKNILRLKWPWNAAFDHKAVFIPEAGPLPSLTLAGGMKITLLSPTNRALAELRPQWEDEVRTANLVPGFGMQPNDDLPEEAEQSFDLTGLPDIDLLLQTPFQADTSEANASSIAFLGEFEGKRAVFAADAHAETLLSSFNRLSPDQKVSLDLYKVSHHGSKYTTTKELVEKVDCPLYIFSTNGSIFKHPDRETVARVISAGGDQPHLVFNYRSTLNQVWDLSKLKDKYTYTTTYPEISGKGIEIEI